jgi:8-oxo-dGTP pyrophosphatase MutT (NUDIX family)
MARGGESSTWPVRHVASYGGVVVRSTDNGPEVALIRPMSSDSKDDGQRAPRDAQRSKEVWALPKGAKEEGESGPEAAVREVLEETGLAAEVVQAIEPITYWFAWAPDKVRYRKTVHFFLMRHVDGEPIPDAFEVAEVRFVPLAGAAKQATYTSERKVLKAAAELAADW